MSQAATADAGPILAVNAGSSSLRLAAFDPRPDPPRMLIRVRADFGVDPPRLETTSGDGRRLARPAVPLGPETRSELVPRILAWAERELGASVSAVGHRIVHGGAIPGPTRVTEPVLRQLEELAPLAPLHQAQGLAPVRALSAARPGLPQVAVFDTAFHRDHEPVVDRLGLPHAWEARGLKRYGFHGLSYEYVARRLAEFDPRTGAGRVVAAHLGSGASLCAMAGGRSVDSTMGATPLDGLLMATRSGSVDPGVILYLQQACGLGATELSELLYRQSGLLGVSGESGDMRRLLASGSERARAAVELFVFRIARETAALAGTLGGLDGFVFTGGIGENSPEVRAAVCRRLRWLGVDLDGEANGAGEPRISTARSRVAVWVVPTDEEQVIAIHTRRLSLQDEKADASH